MTAPIVLVTQPSLANEAKQILADAGSRVSYIHEPPISEDELCEAVSRDGTTAILLRGSPPLTRRVIDAAKNLRFISKHGSGIDSVDLDALNERGIPIVVAAGASADAVAEHTVAMMLALTRDLPTHDRNLRNGIWNKTHYLGTEFRGRLVGIVGLGAIGRRVAKLVQAFGARVVVYSRTRPADGAGVEWEDSLDRLFSSVDLLSLHCPLSEQTRGMVNARTLALMKPDAILINTARGKLVDELALHTALSTGKLKAAGLETFVQEPVNPNNPLLQLPNVLSTPHIAPNTRETLIRVGVVAATQIVDYLRDGTLIETNLVNREVRREGK